MEFVAACRECKKPFMHWSSTRPPVRTTRCRCGGEAVVSQSSDLPDMMVMLEEVFGGASIRKTKLTVLGMADDLADTQAVYKQLRAQAPSGSLPRGSHDLKVGAALCGTFTSAAALYVLTQAPGAPSLDEQARDLAIRVWKAREAENAWIPGPSEPVPVLGRASGKPKPKKDSPRKNQSPDQIGISSEPKRERRGTKSAKKK